ncbi:hypothetical protein [Nakamurella endophytica]|uniref:Uncharacterized protein n=1 Tax=Nakamurella endophytica TaxID=1748367 RepID=A0A917TDX6_9ACTN|nr:hypothetical protein [Nakamurella endophytica]GGM18769.1 hypothetical protein GCM10011594_43570 [Nakamurella endophytica]
MTLGNDQFDADFWRRQSVGLRLFDRVEEVLGDRVLECRFLPDRTPQVLLEQVGPDDVRVIGNLAQGIGLSGEVKVVAAAHGAVSRWQQLAQDLDELRRRSPGVLLQYPTASSRFQPEPHRIALTATAEDVAAALHGRYGAAVTLQVGALRYPPDPAATPLRASFPSLPVMDPGRADIRLQAELTVTRGATVRTAVVLTNRSASPLEVQTNGQLTAQILDPETGAVAGGFVGAQTLPLIPFTAGPRGGRVEIPLLVGTASMRPELGYTLPPGRWQLTAPLDLADGTQHRIPALNFNITD